MAVDKLVDSTQLDSDLTAVANAIRTKGGTSASLAFPSGFVDAIDAIETGGGGGGKTYGLIAEYTVTESVSVISLSLPELVQSDGLAFLECVNLAHTSDYIYPEVGTVGNHNNELYFAKGTTENRLSTVMFSAKKEIGTLSFSGAFAFSGTAGGKVNQRSTAWVPNSIRLTLYAAASVFTSGTVRLYGRIA